MLRVLVRAVFYLFFILVGMAVLSPAKATVERFDVSYLWHRNLDSVLDYRREVGRILGPGVWKNLRVVTSGDLFGLLYYRRYDSSNARKVADSHTSVLRSKGLEAAAPVRSRNWTFVGSANTPPPSAEPAAKPAATPPKASGDRTREIRDLEAAVEDYIKRLRKQGRISADERTGWSVYDFTTGEKLVTINEDVQFQAASLIKPFLAAAFFHQVEQGDLKYGNKSRRHMERMIQRSDNSSTNWVTRQVGGPRAVERILKQNYPGIFRDIHLVEYIPAGGKTYRNKASVHDYSRFLYALWKEKIPGAREIKRLMALQGSDRIYTGAKKVPKGTRVYNKTGSTSRLCGDMGILSVRGPNGKRYSYTVIGVIEKQVPARNYSAWIRSRGDIIRNVSSIVYQGIAEQHDLI